MLAINSRNTPTLPQLDTPREQLMRRNQLAQSGTLYQWNDSVPSLPGVPLAKAVPKGDQPTISWLLAVAEIAVDIVVNQLMAQRADPNNHQARSSQAPLRSNLNDIRTSLTRMRGEQDAHRKSPFRMAYHSALMLTGVRRNRLNSELDVLQETISSSYLNSGPKADLNRYRELFASLPLPAIADSFQHNDTFARMRVAGPNSLLLQGIIQLPDNVVLSNAQYQQVMGGDDDLNTALNEQRVFLTDYAELGNLVPGFTDGAQKYLVLPMALFAVPKGGQSLVPVAIQLGQDPTKHPTFLRVDSSASPEWWSWQMACTMVQVADINYHELFVHLGRTHLVIEAFAVATHRTMASEHPINVLLLPHFEGTLFINNLAAGILITEGGPIDKIFAGTITSTQQTTSTDRLGFDFYEHMLPRDLQRRCVDNVNSLQDYPYRDDAILVWNAIHSWVTDYLSVYYQSDADITGDYELVAWVNEIQSSGKIKGFNAITSLAQLVDVLTMVIFTASAQHAAVNFPQRALMSYAPAITGAAWSPPPSGSVPMGEGDWLNLFPPIPEAQQQLNTLWLLGSIQYGQLGDYRINDWPCQQWFRDPRIIKEGGPLSRFQKSLKLIDREIDRRNSNQQQRPTPYVYLKPSLIPNSINI